jgi:hypothetical protein
MGSCGCGSTVQGDPTMCITQWDTYRRVVSYTEKDDDGVQVPLDGDDYTAQLVIRRGYNAPILLDINSADDPDEIFVSTDAGSVVVNIELDASTTAMLPVGNGYRHTLRIFLTADPDQSEVLTNASASVKATAVGA